MTCCAGLAQEMCITQMSIRLVVVEHGFIEPFSYVHYVGPSTVCCSPAISRGHQRHCSCSEITSMICHTAATVGATCPDSTSLGQKDIKQRQCALQGGFQRVETSKCRCSCWLPLPLSQPSAYLTAPRHSSKLNCLWRTGPTGIQANSS